MTVSVPHPRQQDGLLPYLTYHLPCGLRSPGAARTLMGEALQAFPGETVASAQLLVSELVTNAVLHAGTPIVLHIYLFGEQIRVVVSDGSRLHPVAGPMSDDAAAGGRGLPLVEALSTGWGWDRTLTGKSVWFEL